VSELDIRIGDCREVMAAMEPASVDAIVTDPPYFLTGDSGSGFMGKEWDSLSPVAAVVGALFRCASLDFGTVVERTADAPASTRRSKSSDRTSPAPDVEQCSNALRPTSNPSTSSALELVITKAEALALCAELSASLTDVVAALPAHVRFVASRSRLALRGGSIAGVVANTWLAEPAWLEDATTSSSTAQPSGSVIGETTGPSFDALSTSAMAGGAGPAGSDATASESSVTTSSRLNSLETIRRITSSPCVSRVMRECTQDQSFIPSLSESRHHAWAVEAFRVAKPGAHLVAFGGTRTFHRLACAIEDAGWEIRDSIGFAHAATTEAEEGGAGEAAAGPLAWIYGSGFP